MKKLILLMLLFPLLASSLLAQRHEILLALNGPTGGSRFTGSSSDYFWYDDLEGMYSPYVDRSPSAGIDLEYNYAYRWWLRFGADLSLGGYNLTTRTSRVLGAVEYRNREVTFCTWMPQVKLFGVDTPHFKLYGRAGLGVQFSVGHEIRRGLHPAWNVTPLGLQWGGERVFAFADAGFGTLYYGRIGFGVRF